jgi:hypothetical protein
VYRLIEDLRECGAPIEDGEIQPALGMPTSTGRVDSPHILRPNCQS